MLKILLIDDDDALREKISKELNLNNFYVKCLTDGSGIINELQKEDYNLIITDIVMPGKEGIETIHDIREINPQIPILAISGGGRTSAVMILEMAKLMGANDTLFKPFDVNSLIKKIKEILKTETES